MGDARDRFKQKPNLKGPYRLLTKTSVRFVTIPDISRYKPFYDYWTKTIVRQEWLDHQLSIMRYGPSCDLKVSFIGLSCDQHYLDRSAAKCLK